MDHSKLSDTELALLGLIAEAGPLSGYRLIALATERGMSHWANLSPSNTYNHLKKLRGNELVLAVQDNAKHGRGPAGLQYTISTKGSKALPAQIECFLVEGREQSAAFKLAVAFSACIPQERLVALLVQREAAIHDRLEQVQSARAVLRAGGNVPLSTVMLFEYVVQGLKHEMQMAKVLALEVSKKKVHQ